MSKFNIWNKWDPLKVCMLGNNYTPEYFDGLNNAAETPLKRICNETLEDLEGFKIILQDFGVEVIQPVMDNSERFIADHLVAGARGPLQPRDFQLVLGNKCFIWPHLDHPALAHCLRDYSDKCIDMPPWDIAEEPLTSAKVFMIGKDVYHIIVSDPKLAPVHDAMFKNHRSNILPPTVEGHADGSFHTIKPGAILSLHDVQNYESTFPGWDICFLEDESWSKVMGWSNLKNKNAGKWYLAGEENNDEFIHFVNTWLSDWVGYVEESVFDVNVLVLDEHHVCVSNMNNPIVNAFLKKHKMEPVYVPWRHRFFWDGGLHCITLDLVREGTQQDYFPERADHDIVHKF